MEVDGSSLEERVRHRNRASSLLEPTREEEARKT